MVAVFAGMAMGDMAMFQQLGFGLAVAIAIDATIVRTVIVPSAMTLFGRSCWYLPRWLHWLPRVKMDEPTPRRPRARPRRSRRGGRPGAVGAGGGARGGGTGPPVGRARAAQSSRGPVLPPQGDDRAVRRVYHGGDAGVEAGGCAMRQRQEEQLMRWFGKIVGWVVGYVA